MFLCNNPFKNSETRSLAGKPAKAEKVGQRNRVNRKAGSNVGNKILVHVQDSNQEPVEGVTVELYVFSGLWARGGDMEGETDEDGHAFMETADDYESSRQIKFEVRGQEFGPYEIGDSPFTVEI